MNLFIPEIGTKLKLTNSWNFNLFNEYRNSSFLKFIDPYNKIVDSVKVTMPTDTILSVDRIYIRKGVSGYSSITFNISKLDNKKHPLAGYRFLVKLSDANNIEFELLNCNEESLSLIKQIDSRTKENLSAKTQSKFMKLFLVNKTVNNIRPSELPSFYIDKIVYLIGEYRKDSMLLGYDIHMTPDKLEEILIPFIRMYKITDLYSDNTNK